MTIYIPPMPIRPSGSAVYLGEVYLRFGSEIVHLYKSSELAKRILEENKIIIAEADEGLCRTTLVSHNVETHAIGGDSK